MPAGLEALRAATRGLHAAVESTAVMQGMLCSPLSATTYGQYLVALAASIAPLAARLQQTEARPALASTEAWACLAQDLGALAVAWPAVVETPPEPAHPDAIWGRIYVVRGAEAGLSIVARQLDRLGGAANLPRRFLDAVLAQRCDWPRICRVLDQLEGPAQRAAVELAVADFRFALAALSACAPAPEVSA
ncbi:hypothetical protein [Aquimonas voraii]|uniref:Heme oxygenase n=1 Tax=Aquimonas voraii TaxID=265719 RepID=A0A1G6ZH52_9GAMM|nr:hypothetical protein [Aquimonas voraii]SDE01988.1 Heme oxygenase [Aquimonas voraii]